MIYEFRFKKLGSMGKRKAVCVFCGKKVTGRDYLYMCKEHGDLYYKITKFWRMLLPKFIMKLIIESE
jgi:hypothetical protein